MFPEIASPVLKWAKAKPGETRRNPNVRGSYCCCAIVGTLRHLTSSTLQFMMSRICQCLVCFLASCWWTQYFILIHNSVSLFCACAAGANIAPADSSPAHLYEIPTTATESEKCQQTISMGFQKINIIEFHQNSSNSINIPSKCC